MNRRLTTALALGLALPAFPAAAQVPGLPVPAAAAKEKVKEEKKGGETISATAGPIKVKDTVDPRAIADTLNSLLPLFPGVRWVKVTVTRGVVMLDGQVDDDDTRNDMTNVAKQVEGVRMVANRLATDDEVLTAPQLVLEKVAAIWGVVRRRWLLGLLALGVVMAFSGMARVFNGYAETLLAPFLKNVMLRSVAGSLISSAIVLGGLVFGLSILNLTHAVLSVLGLASIVGLAVGFAFKDITENFIASVLLGIRRPFRVGDYVTVAGQTGVVRSLNTRATVLVTLEGNHIRIPNNIIYKEILINATASPSYRVSFDVVVPYEASASAATDAMTSALHQVDGVLHDPPPRALVEALEPGGVRLKAYYWVPVQDVDWYKINSDAKLRVKVALQQAKVLAPASPADLAVAPVAANGLSPEPPRPLPSAKADANLLKDAHAADAARSAPPTDAPTPMERVLSESETRVSEEGANLLVANGKSEK